MKYLRAVDKLSHSLAASQARIFEKSSSFGIPSKIFIKSYMLSEDAFLIDNLQLDVAGLSEIEIFERIKTKISQKNGLLYPFSTMYYIGYFYRMAAYLTGCNSKFLYQNIKPDLIYRNYQVLHSLPIEEAIKDVFELAKIKIEDKYEIFKKIYKIDKKIK